MSKIYEKYNAEGYDRLINKEAEFWAKFDETNTTFGIPHWIDLQNATFLNTSKTWPWADPVVENLFFGTYKSKIINECRISGGKILEIGCGGGWLSLELARNGLDVTGLDVSEKRLNIGKQYAERNNVKINYIKADINNYEFKESENYDVIVAWDSLHHFINLDIIMGKLKEILKPDGFLIYMDHKSNFNRRFMDYLRLYLLRIPPETNSPFEDIKTNEIVPITMNHFDIIEKHSYLCFAKIISEMLCFFNINISNKFVFSFIKILTNIDTMFCSLFKSRGEFAFVKAKRKIVKE